MRMPALGAGCWMKTSDEKGDTKCRPLSCVARLAPRHLIPRPTARPIWLSREPARSNNNFDASLTPPAQPAACLRHRSHHVALETVLPPVQLERRRWQARHRLGLEARPARLAPGPAPAPWVWLAFALGILAQVQAGTRLGLAPRAQLSELCRPRAPPRKRQGARAAQRQHQQCGEGAPPGQWREECAQRTRIKAEREQWQRRSCVCGQRAGELKAGPERSK